MPPPRCRSRFSSRPAAGTGRTRRRSMNGLKRGRSGARIEAAPIPPMAADRRASVAAAHGGAVRAGTTRRRAAGTVGRLSGARVRRHEAGDHRSQQSDPAGIQDRDRQDADHSRRRPAGEARAPVRAAAAEKPPAPPAERPAAAAEPAKAGEVIPLDEPGAGPEEIGEAAGDQLSAAGRSDRTAKLSPPAAEPADRRADPPRRPSHRRRRTSRRAEAGIFHGRCAAAFSPVTARQRRAARMPASISRRPAAPRSAQSIPASSPMPATRSAATAISCWSSIRTA